MGIIIQMKPKQKIRFQENVVTEVSDELIRIINKIKTVQPELFKKSR